MQDEQTWMDSQDSSISMAKERYEYYLRPEPRDNMSDIYHEEDEFLGTAKCRDVRVGMLRGAKEENKKTVKAYLEPFPHIRVDSIKPLQGWYKALHEAPNVRPRPCFTEAILTEPYGGYCAVGCQFCYINSGNRGYRGTGLISVPLHYELQVRKQLSTIRRGAAAYFSSFTDPFTPLEHFYHNTQHGAEEFVKVGLPIFFLSRLQYPDWAIELLTKNPHSYAQKSMNTCDERDWRLLSPGAISLKEHLADIRKLKKAGIYVSIQCNPIVPGITSNQQVMKLFDMLADAGVDHVIVKFVEANYSWAPAMVERMVKRFGQRGKIFESLFTDNMGGERCVEESYRLKAHDLLSKHAAKVGLTYATCYEYRYERNSDGSIVSKTGVSIGRDYTTADQCHGHQVPVYARNSADEMFTPLEACPPSGCLYCADENEGKARCGDETAGSAIALKLADMKVPIGGTPDKSRRGLSLTVLSPKEESRGSLFES
jgi:DNA repair photolyase